MKTLCWEFPQNWTEIYEKLKVCSAQWCHWAQKKGRSDYFAAFFAQWNVTLPLAHTSMYLLTTQTRLLLKVVSVMRFKVYGRWFMTSIGTVEFIRAGIPCCHSPFGSFASRLDSFAVSLAQNLVQCLSRDPKHRLAAKNLSQRQLPGIQPNVRADIKGYNRK